MRPSSGQGRSSRAVHGERALGGAQPCHALLEDEAVASRNLARPDVGLHRGVAGVGRVRDAAAGLSIAGTEVLDRDGEHEAVPIGNGVAEGRPNGPTPPTNNVSATASPTTARPIPRKTVPWAWDAAGCSRPAGLQAAQSASVSGTAAPHRTQACVSAGAAGLSAPESVLGASLTCPIFPRATPSARRHVGAGRHAGAVASALPRAREGRGDRRPTAEREGTAMADRAEIGVFGGSGFYSLLEDVREIKVDTPYGPPSDSVFLAEVGGRRSPSCRATGGATRSRRTGSTTGRTSGRCARSASRRSSPRAPPARSSCDVKPGDFVVCDQFVDRTSGRADTFYDGPIVTHLSSADIYDPILRAIAADVIREHGITAPRAGHGRRHPGPALLDARPSRSGSATPAGRSST